MKRYLAIAAIGGIALMMMDGCKRTSEVLIVSKILKKEIAVSTAVPGEFGDFAPATSNLFWVEGKIRNQGSEELRNVQLTFKGTDGAKSVLFAVDIPLIGAGKTIDYKTRIMESRVEVKLLEEDPEIRVP